MVVEAWNPYPQMFSVLWNGKRHVMMGASQIDRFGNQNIACIGDWHQPKAQLLGFRGAPGNTINHTTSYWVPNHTPKVFVEQVDVVCGVGYDRAAELGPVASRFHEIRRVVTNLGVFDFETPDHRMRLRSVHPGVDGRRRRRGDRLRAGDPRRRAPRRGCRPTRSSRLIRDVIDPNETCAAEVATGERDAMTHPRCTPGRASCSASSYPIVQTGMGWVAGRPPDRGHEPRPAASASWRRPR